MVVWDGRYWYGVVRVVRSGMRSDMVIQGGTEWYGVVFHKNIVCELVQKEIKKS